MKLVRFILPFLFSTLAHSFIKDKEFGEDIDETKAGGVDYFDEYFDEN